MPALAPRPPPAPCSSGAAAPGLPTGATAERGFPGRITGATSRRGGNPTALRAPSRPPTLAVHRASPPRLGVGRLDAESSFH
jgi:hypothetical protein